MSVFDSTQFELEDRIKQMILKTQQQIRELNQEIAAKVQAPGGINREQETDFSNRNHKLECVMRTLVFAQSAVQLGNWRLAASHIMNIIVLKGY